MDLLSTYGIMLSLMMGGVVEVICDDEEEFLVIKKVINDRVKLLLSVLNN